MSDLELNPMFRSMRKSLGDIVIYERDGKLYTRVKPKKTAAQTPAQLEVTNTFSRLSSDWKSAGTLMKSSWHRPGDKKSRRGMQLYLKTNFKNEREGKAVELFRSEGEILPPVITAAPGGSGEILCTYTVPAEEAGRHIHFYVKKRTEGISDGKIRRFSPGENGSNPFTMSGFEPGGEYFIYAALADNTHDEAKLVSAAVSVISSAGM
ncbi:MAG TPA: fibronectin type III domain-containing protein [Spirochaetota bacterium]|nr:fibronectin type III domain-containing protein [Spirochaetota bacterium]